MCLQCLAHYLAELILSQKRSPSSVSQYLAREYGDYQADVIMLEVNRLASIANKRGTRVVRTLGKARFCRCEF